MQFHKHTLANGLTLIGESNPAARSASVGFIVRTGSRDETPEESGVSHFLEHMVFKGTPRRTALDVNRDFDRIGADYNAYTSEEATVFYASILPEYLTDAVDVLADILRPSLRDDDFDMEKKVILDEIGRYEDMPGYCAYDHAKELYFATHLLGNRILGTTRSVSALTRELMHGYFNRRYLASNIIVSVAGNVDWPRFVQDVSGRCADWPGGSVGRIGVEETAGSGKFEVEAKDSVTQEYVVLISSAPPASSPLRYAGEVLATVVGDHVGSRLYWALVDPGLAESADMSYQEYDGAGAFYSSFTCEPEGSEENLAIVHEILGGVQRDGVTQEELAQAKSKLLSRLVRSSERPRGRMMAVGMHWLYQGEYRSLDDDLRGVQEVTLADVRKLLDRYPLDRVTTLAHGPLREMARPGR
jgi:predicted Zn-dependent peptidase